MAQRRRGLVVRVGNFEGSCLGSFSSAKRKTEQRLMCAGRQAAAWALVPCCPSSVTPLVKAVR